MTNWLLCLILFVILIGCEQNHSTNTYREINKKDLQKYSDVYEIWKNSKGDRLLVGYIDNGAIASRGDFILEKNKKNYLLDNSNNGGKTLEIVPYNDSLILFKENPNGDFNKKGWWIEVKSSQNNPIYFSDIDSSKINQIKNQLNDLPEGVYKLENDQLKMVCDYQKYKEWGEIINEGCGIYYFSSPGDFYKYKINLNNIN